MDFSCYILENNISQTCPRYRVSWFLAYPICCNYRYRVFGDPPSTRSAEDLAFSVARFFSKNGTLVNYYMVINDLIMQCIQLIFLFFIFFMKLTYVHCICYSTQCETNFSLSTMVEQILVEQALTSVQPNITMKPLLMSTVLKKNQNGVT